ncbi:sugar 3,4-ketoisomerase [Adhaeribacter aquaticus]|uniref:sugar 3,4-ketoisomerase n=1 Tax=Adhaeribacter aquaticus TaxID=299567 RepID=UPI0004240D3F|nr:FdtA/QdtA family cupin domain-containing protein [Adhaeribacter aquaticus]
MIEPHLLKFDSFDELEKGLLTSTQMAEKLPFLVKRVFWVQNVNPDKTRGSHAGYKTEEILIAIQGNVTVQIQTLTRRKSEFILHQPNHGLYIPPKCWRTLSFSEDAILLCLASTDY